jgi:hypothetical protein
VENVDNIEGTRADHTIFRRRNVLEILGTKKKIKLRTCIYSKSHSHLFVGTMILQVIGLLHQKRIRQFLVLLMKLVVNLQLNLRQLLHLFQLLNFQIHCFIMTAAAEPKPFSLNFDENLHLLACVLYSSFENCCEADSNLTIDLLRVAKSKRLNANKPESVVLR